MNTVFHQFLNDTCNFCTRRQILIIIREKLDKTDPTRNLVFFDEARILHKTILRTGLVQHVLEAPLKTRTQTKISLLFSDLSLISRLLEVRIYDDLIILGMTNLNLSF